MSSRVSQMRDGADVPPHDLDAEAAVLSAILLDPARLDDVRDRLSARHFYSRPNGRIYEAIIALRADQRPVDIVSVAGWLRDHERLQEIGGTSYLAQLSDATPAVANIADHASIVVTKWQARRTVDVGRRVIVELNAPGADVVGIARAAADDLTAITTEPAPNSRTLVSCAVDLGDLSVAPKSLVWLLSDTRTQKPVLRAGQIWNVSADGGTGKGYFYLQAGVCVALGRDLFDTFRPQLDGHAALLLSEDDVPEIRHRLWRICNAYHLSAEERARVTERLHVFSLVGRQSAILRTDAAGNAERTALASELTDYLGELAAKGSFDWSLVALDPLARFAGGEVEKDNDQATEFARVLEGIVAALPGTPSVGCSHHSSKFSVRAGKPDVRGVSGIRDAFRSVFVLGSVRAAGLRGVLLVHDKSNGAPEAEPLWLVRAENEPMADGRWLETGGTLRRATPDEADRLSQAAGLASGSPDERREAREQARGAEKISKAQARREAVVSVLPFAPAHSTTAQVQAALEQKGFPRASAGPGAELRELAELGQAIDLSRGEGRTRQWCRPQASNGGVQ